MKQLTVRNSGETFYVGKIVCVGQNYADHVKELGNTLPEEPLIFLKPASNIIFSGDKVIHPPYSENLQHEAELVLLIGKDIRNAATAEEAEEAIAGYGIGLDMTLRDLQFRLRKKGEPWTLAKCFDTSAVLSDFVLKSDHSLTLEENITLKVNGETRQNSYLNKMIFRPSELVKYISSVMTLERGDLVFTGTPEGVSRVYPGDTIEASISGLASLRTSVV